MNCKPFALARVNDLLNSFLTSCLIVIYTKPKVIKTITDKIVR